VKKAAVPHQLRICHYVLSLPGREERYPREIGTARCHQHQTGKDGCVSDIEIELLRPDTRDVRIGAEPCAKLHDIVGEATMSNQKTAGIARLLAAEDGPFELHDGAEASFRLIDLCRCDSFAPNAETADFSGLDISLKLFEEFIAQISEDCLVQKENVDIVGSQCREACVDGCPQLIR
jgi:hypothetical protein